MKNSLFDENFTPADQLEFEIDTLNVFFDDIEWALKLGNRKKKQQFIKELCHQGKLYLGKQLKKIKEEYIITPKGKNEV